MSIDKMANTSKTPPLKQDTKTIRFAVIGGSGLSDIQGLKVIHREVVHTPYGEPSGQFTHGMLGNRRIVFLARHGYTHSIPPHKVNYRANIWALRHLGVKKVVAIAACGGITAAMKPRTLVIPDQIIDYTHGRPQTFFEEGLNSVTHIDFTYPYCSALRQALLDAAQQAGLSVVTGGSYSNTQGPQALLDAAQQAGLAVVAGGTYAATQGPRLETAAEIRRLEQDGNDLVGMTGMPEASLAKEAGLSYATCAVIANWAAGKTTGEISLEKIHEHLAMSMGNVHQLLRHLVC